MDTPLRDGLRWAESRISSARNLQTAVVTRSERLEPVPILQVRIATELARKTFPKRTGRSVGGVRMRRRDEELSPQRAEHLISRPTENSLKADGPYVKASGQAGLKIEILRRYQYL